MSWRLFVVVWCVAWGLGCERRAPTAQVKTVPVFAASSLTEAFVALERQFEAANPELDVALHFGGSQALRLQIEQGADAAVFASAHPEHMDALYQQGMVLAPKTLTHNLLVVAVPEGSSIQRFEQLGQAARIVVGAAQVPAGRYAAEVIEASPAALKAHIKAHIVSQEPNVRLVISKVAQGEADAAFVYRTDVLAQRRAGAPLLEIPIPTSAQTPTRYLISPTLKSGSPSAGAQRWVDFVLSSAGQAVLAEHGFGDGGA